ncbi:c-type cytochrome [Thalassotalea nanhaiensis]|uniref:C-type cytochrome n=1 Tax=Thalassotalea nanhaiensis TaxID=3065648 RepID=A0ABY9TJU5_9GAMM|nr:c-type cytochrome [Colwelliaceae bacterium SQ345]
MRSSNSSGLLSATLFHFKNFYKLILLVSILLLAGCDHDDDDNDDKNPDANITANAGVDQQVTSQVIVTLPGSGTTDTGTISTYAWTQISGDSVTLLNSDFATASFTSPSNPTDNVLTFELTVTDTEGNFATDTVDITVQVDGGGGTVPPTAEAGSDKTAMYGDVVNLFGLGTDSDGSIVSYQWLQVSGATVTLINPTFPTTKFTVPDIEPGDLVFELTVTDNDGLTATDTVTVTIEGEVVPPPIDGVVLFETHCGGCHTANGLGTPGGSDKTGRTAEQITDAIATVSAMNSLDFLTAEEIQAISVAITPEEIDGAALFESDCGGCHTGNGLGSGSSGPDLTSYTFEQLTSRQDMVGHLSDPEVQAIADALVPEIIDGAALFESDCGGCHTGNGLGSGSSGPDLTSYTFEQLTARQDMVGHLTDPEVQAIADALVPEIIDGAALFESDCGGCHTGNGLGSGSSGPDLTSYTFEQLTARQDMVGHLTDPEVQAIADALVPEVLDGAQIFTDTCGGCHTANGLGSGSSDKTNRNVTQIMNANMTQGLSDLELQAVEAAITNQVQLFDDSCSGCHSRADKANRTAAQIADAIATVGSMMTADLEILNDRQLGVISDELIDGADLFTNTCGGCHTANGLGSGSSDKTNRNVTQIMNANMTQGLSDIQLQAVEEAITNQVQLFDDSCSGCHSRADKANRTAAQIANAIATVGSMMTAELEILNDRQLGVISDELIDGPTLFTDTCGGCHTANGLGSGSSDKTNRNITQIMNANMTQGLSDIQLQAVEEAITNQVQLFDDSCSGCHTRADKANRTAAQIADAIATVGSMMTADLEVLNDRQLGVISDELIDGADLFTNTCGGCHTANGLGSGSSDKTNKNIEQIKGASMTQGLSDIQLQAVEEAITNQVQLFDDSCSGCHTRADKANSSAAEIANAIATVGSMMIADLEILNDRQLGVISDELIDGADLFTNTCGGCHTANGLGSGSSDKTNKNIEQIKGAGMTQGLSDIQLQAVEEAITNQVQLFDDRCSGCHTRADKANRSAAEIANAIETVGSMMIADLEILNDRQLDVISDELIDGADLFTNTCGGCHTANGLGTGSSDKTNKNIEQIKGASMTQGLSDIQLQAVEEAITNQVQLFDDRCSGCHTRADKANRTAAQIANAIATVGSMMIADLEILNDRQLDVISDELIDGALLFTSNCSGCHSEAGKANATFADISGAIDNNTGGMGQFSDFNDMQIQAIADYLIDGALLFTSNCSGCHSEAAKANATFADISGAIDNNTGGMGQFSDFNDMQIQAIADYLIDGAALFTNNCTDCHQGNGMGSSGSDKTDATFAEISGAIDGDFGGMGQFSSYTDPQIQAIADALLSTP